MEEENYELSWVIEEGKKYDDWAKWWDEWIVEKTTFLLASVIAVLVVEGIRDVKDE